MDVASITPKAERPGIQCRRDQHTPSGEHNIVPNFNSAAPIQKYLVIDCAIPANDDPPPFNDREIAKDNDTAPHQQPSLALQ